MEGVIAVFPFLSALSSDTCLFIKGQEKRSGTPTADKKESTPTVLSLFTIHIDIESVQ